MVLMRTDPFRELDRWTQQVLGTAARPAVMPMDGWPDTLQASTICRDEIAAAARRDDATLRS
jgi:hypothetical protein